MENRGQCPPRTFTLHRRMFHHDERGFGIR